MCAVFVFVRVRCRGMRMFVRVRRAAFVVRMLVLRVLVRMLVRMRYFFVRMFVFVVCHSLCSFTKIKIVNACHYNPLVFIMAIAYLVERLINFSVRLPPAYVFVKLN